MNHETYYDILQISKEASQEEIRAAYIKLAKKFHPDLYHGDIKIAEEQMKKINIAYDTLSNLELRKKYDLTIGEYRNRKTSSYSKNTQNNSTKTTSQNAAASKETGNKNEYTKEKKQDSTQKDENDNRKSKEESLKNETESNDKKEKTIIQRIEDSIINLLSYVFWIAVIIVLVKKTNIVNYVMSHLNINQQETVISDEQIETMANEIYENYFPVYFILNYERNSIMNKEKEMQIQIDGNEVSIVNSSGISRYVMILKEGEHKVSFSSGAILKKEYSFKVGKDKLNEDNENFLMIKVFHSSSKLAIEASYSTNMDGNPKEYEKVVNIVKEELNCDYIPVYPYQDVIDFVAERGNYE